MRATRILPPSTLLNNGQTCYLGTRVLAPRSRYDEVVQTIAAIASSMPVGDALDPATMIGPMASSRHRDRVEGCIRTAREEGARLVTGGGRPDGPGWFVEPTVFADVSNDQTIAREEVFGPVLSIIPYDGEEDAIRIANDSEYGLGGSVWTTDTEGLLAYQQLQSIYCRLPAKAEDRQAGQSASARSMSSASSGWW